MRGNFSGECAHCGLFVLVSGYKYNTFFTFLHLGLDTTYLTKTLCKV